MNQTLKFESVSTIGIAAKITRARVPGGWLVLVHEEVLSPIDYGYEKPVYERNHEWRTSITFVPDPTHQWLSNLVINKPTEFIDRKY